MNTDETARKKAQDEYLAKYHPELYKASQQGIDRYRAERLERELLERLTSATTDGG